MIIILIVNLQASNQNTISINHRTNSKNKKHINQTANRVTKKILKKKQVNKVQNIPKKTVVIPLNEDARLIRNLAVSVAHFFNDLIVFFKKLYSQKTTQYQDYQWLTDNEITLLKKLIAKLYKNNTNSNLFNNKDLSFLRILIICIKLSLLDININAKDVGLLQCINYIQKEYNTQQRSNVSLSQKDYFEKIIFHLRQFVFSLFLEELALTKSLKRKLLFYINEGIKVLPELIILRDNNRIKHCRESQLKCKRKMRERQKNKPYNRKHQLANNIILSVLQQSNQCYGGTTTNIQQIDNISLISTDCYNNFEQYIHEPHQQKIAQQTIINNYQELNILPIEAFISLNDSNNMIYCE
jgi:hypothetical protein